MGAWGDAGLLERYAELAAVDRLLERASIGDGALLLVEGPAGIGKSSLLTAASRIAVHRGFGVLGAHGSPLEGELSFGIAFQLLEPAIHAASDLEREELFSGAAGIVRPIFEVGSTSADEVPAELDISLGVLHGLYWLVADLADRRPLLIAVDDAQWADDASLRFLHYLTQRLAGLAVAIVVAVRTGEAEAENGTLAELSRHPAGDIMALDPLSETAVATVVAAELPGAEEEFRVACARLTAGNPYYLRALLAAVAEDAIPPTAAGARSLGRLGRKAVGRAVLSRLGRMPATHRALARAATVFPDGAPLARVAAVAELLGDEAATAADSLAAANVFERGEPVGFAHPLVREAIYAELSAAERGRGHRRAARLLHDEHAAPEVVATHLLHSDYGRETWAVDVLCAAAARVRSRGDPAAAAAYLERALAEGGGLERRGEILFQLGLVEAMQGHSSGEELILDAAAAIPDTNVRAFALMNLARILAVRGRYGESARAFRHASEVLAGTGSELAWWAEAGYAMAGSLGPATRGETSPLLERFLEDPGVDLLEQFAIGRSVLAFVAAERAYVSRPAAEALEPALRIVSHELGDIEENGVAFRIAAAVLAWCGKLDEAERVADAMLAAARRQGSSVEVAAASYPRIHILIQRGRPADAMREAMTSIDGLQMGWGVAVPAAHVALSWGHLERGELREAEQALELPDGEERWRGDLSLAFVGEARGAVRLARGDVAGALRTLLEAGERLDELGVVNPTLSPFPWRSGAAVAAAAVGERGRALAMAHEQLSLAERFGVARAIGAALRTRGLVHGGEDGIAWLRRSVERLDGTPYELELARSLVELGGALRRLGARRDAREPLGRGVGLARECGALALAERGHEELRAAGARPRTLALRGTEALTPSERRVADLAATGLTNRQIAAQLFLSRKTVEAHLGAIYRKLEVDRRGLSDALDRRLADAATPTSRST